MLGGGSFFVQNHKRLGIYRGLFRGLFYLSSGGVSDASDISAKTV